MIGRKINGHYHAKRSVECGAVADRVKERLVKSTWKIEEIVRVIADENER